MKMDNIARIYDYLNYHCVNISGETNQIPDRTLNKLLQKHKFYAEFDVLHVETNEKCSFYENMADHPRLDEFIKADVEYAFHSVFDTRCENPEISKKIEEAILAKLCERIGFSPDLIEEFLHFTQNRKSARADAAARTAD